MATLEKFLELPQLAVINLYIYIYIYIKFLPLFQFDFFFFFEKMLEILFIYFIFACAAVKHGGKSSTQTFTVSTSPSIEAKAP